MAFKRSGVRLPVAPPEKPKGQREQPPALFCFPTDGKVRGGGWKPLETPPKDRISGIPLGAVSSGLWRIGGLGGRPGDPPAFQKELENGAVIRSFEDLREIFPGVGDPCRGDVFVPLHFSPDLAALHVSGRFPGHEPDFQSTLVPSLISYFAPG